MLKRTERFSDSGDPWSGKKKEQRLTFGASRLVEKFVPSLEACCAWVSREGTWDVPGI